MSSRRIPLSISITVVVLLTWATSNRPIAAESELPARLTDQAFWQLSGMLSEPDGTFQSDNLLSNELVFGRIVPDLESHAGPGGVYLGVGPEQNFTYIAAMEPRIAFITDIRRGNLQLQLMYKALFELSADRADFVSRLFTKKRPAGLTRTTTATELMNAYWDEFSSDEAAYNANLQAILTTLTRTHNLPLTQEDLDGIARVYRAFYWYGPAMNYSASVQLGLSGVGRGTTYWDLMTQVDPTGQSVAYLGSEERFAFVKELERRNLIVPVVGNFSGPKALRAVGDYLRSHGATVSAFYVSNVESYLVRDGSWPAFCANVATLPLDDQSVFIRPSGAAVTVISTPASSHYMGQSGDPSLPPGFGLVPMAPEVRSCNGGL